MFIKEISIKNFKSFDDLNLSLNNLNVIIGANSSGKSNFITIFEFLRNISIYGLENAISITGGKDFITNKYVLDNEDVAFKIKYKPPVGKRVIKDSGKQVIGFHISDIEYKFSIHFLKQSSNYQIAEDFIDIKYNFFHGKEDNLFEESNLFSTGNAKIYHDSKNMIAFKTDFSKEIQEYSDAIFPPFFREGEFKMKNEIFLETPIFDFFQGFNNPFKHISIYDFDPKRPKRAVKITGRTNLDEDGNNLSIVLSKIIQNKDNKKRFINLLHDLLPSIDDFNVEKFPDKSLIFIIEEKYNNTMIELPASFISDGTINLVSLILALYFEKKTLSIFEEPERNIHPQLVSKMMAMFEEVSERKQIIVSTHNPEIIKHTNLNDLLFIKRNKSGISEIERLSEDSEVKIFLENEIGIDELFIQNIIGKK